MSNEFSDDISALFDDIQPQDFFRETSAVASEEYLDVINGKVEFEAWVEDNLGKIRDTYNDDPAEFDPVALLHCPNGTRVFLPDDDETNEMYMSRLQREAVQFEATWFCIGMVAPAAVCADRDEAAGGNYVMQEAINWYAEAREPRFNQIRQGIITIRDDKQAGEMLEGTPEGASYLFRSVLNPKLKTS